MENSTTTTMLLATRRTAHLISGFSRFTQKGVKPVSSDFQITFSEEGDCIVSTFSEEEGIKPEFSAIRMRILCDTLLSHQTCSCSFVCFPDFFAVLNPDEPGYIHQTSDVWIRRKQLSIQLDAIPELEYIFFCLGAHFKTEQNRKREEIPVKGGDFQLFIQEVIHCVNNTPTANNDLKKNHLATIQRGKEYIFRNFTRNFSIQELAVHCYVSPFHFSRIFKQFTGYPPARYIHLLRIKQAEILLRGTSLSLKQVSHSCGFKRQDYFSAAFKRKLKISPLTYKNNPEPFKK